ncbi:MAG: hypothetical protein A2Z95_00530 [Gallionellales bacterium GWA2_60_18]|nr:MAG: hypothetical protein A2Z95_00530 [Gallionellales bacterium GWA2_60_18]
MISLPRTSAGRIALAIGLSLLAHALMLLAPMAGLPEIGTPIPPLSARLESLPQSLPKPVPGNLPKPVPKPVRKPENTPTQPAATEAAETTGAAETTTTETADESAPAHPLPRHAQLIFFAYSGEGGMKIGEAVHRLNIEEGRYTLTAITRTTGLAGLFRSYQLAQTSTGITGDPGLQPLRFIEEKQQSGNSQRLEAEFDWPARMLRFSQGGETPLPEQAQDILSFLYQVSQLPANRTSIPLAISNGRKLEHYELEIGAEEVIATPLGSLRAVPLRKKHAAGEEGLDIWMGLEYRLLPVKIRQTERDGRIAGEMIISEIRVADE